MSENVSTEGPARNPSESSAEMDNPPLWSYWNFQTRQRDWHEVIYGEMRSTYVNNENK
jgi:hypothetical protein